MLQKITNSIKDYFSSSNKHKLVVTVTAIIAVVLVVAVIVAAVSGRAISLDVSVNF